MSPKKKNKDTADKLVNEAKRVVSEIDSKKSPTVKLPVRGLQNVHFDEN